MDNFQFDYLISVFPKILKHLNVTIKIAFCSLVFALLLGLFLAMIMRYRIKFLYPISKIYVSFFRSTPFIAQLFFFYYGLASYVSFIKNITAVKAIIIMLAMNSSAYMAEIIRGALESVDKGQMEGALSVGMTTLQGMRRIIIPQAARIAIPGLSNCFIDLIKGSAVGFTIGVVEMMSKAQIEAASSYRHMEVYVATIIIYWVVVSFFTFFQKKLETKMNEAY